jgi:hypothetical protein
MLVLSDGLPNPTITSLDRNFPQATKVRPTSHPTILLVRNLKLLDPRPSTPILLSYQLGLLTEPTPFLTGKPHTLFRDKDIFEAGAVGLAFCETSMEDDPSGQDVSTAGMSVGIGYGGLERLSGLETIDE